jgi:ABC-2 type transport system ATP-binding protein
MIRVEHLTKTFRKGRPPVLSDLSLVIEEGEIFGLIGPNGAGKTTFMGCLLGLLRPDHGTVSVGGRSPDDLELRAATGYLPERLQFERWMTGRRFLEFHHALAKQPGTVREREIDALLVRVGLDPSSHRVPIRRYSRGMLQRLGLAQALIGSPRFLFLDEPASGVDPAGVLAFRKVLMDLRTQRVTVVLNSHQLDQIEQTCDRVAYVAAGRIEAIQELRRVEDQPYILSVHWLAGQAPASREALAALAQQTETDLIDMELIRGRFRVRHQTQAAALVRALVTAGIAVVEAGPESQRLERFFTSSSASPRA